MKREVIEFVEYLDDVGVLNVFVYLYLFNAILTIFNFILDIYEWCK